MQAFIQPLHPFQEGCAPGARFPRRRAAVGRDDGVRPLPPDALGQTKGGGGGGRGAHREARALKAARKCRQEAAMASTHNAGCCQTAHTKGQVDKRRLPGPDVKSQGHRRATSQPHYHGPCCIYGTCKRRTQKDKQSATDPEVKS